MDTRNAKADARFPEVSFEEGLAALVPELRRRALGLTRHSERADDLVQDTMERALRFRSSFRSGSHQRAWLMRILKNTFISHCRRRTTERRVMEGATYDPNGWAALEPTFIRPGLSPRVNEALGELPERLREVVELVDLAEHSYRDAADHQNVPVGTIMSRLHRGRARLARVLADPIAA